MWESFSWNWSWKLEVSPTLRNYSKARGEKEGEEVAAVRLVSWEPNNLQTSHTHKLRQEDLRQCSRAALHRDAELDLGSDLRAKLGSDDVLAKASY